MALTYWDPDTVIQRGNILIGVAPAIVDINSPTLAELNASVVIDCSMTDFNASSSVSTETVDWLCSPVGEALSASLEHSIDDLTIKASGQNDDTLLTQLTPGSTVYLWRRDGIAHTVALEAQQRVWIWKATVASIDPVEASNQFVGYVVHLTALDRVELPVTITA